MSTNCVNCIKNKRTGFDNLCDSCRRTYHKKCKYYKDKTCPIIWDDIKPEPKTICSFCDKI